MCDFVKFAETFASKALVLFAKIRAEITQKDAQVKEVILALDPNIEGEATVTYLARLLEPLDISITRLASGLPVGGDLEYADEITLGRAFAGRQEV